MKFLYKQKLPQLLQPGEHLFLPVRPGDSRLPPAACSFSAPGSIRRRDIFLPPARKPYQSGKVLRLPKGIFRPADAPFYSGLGSISPPVPCQIQLSVIDILHGIPIQPVKKSRRTFHGTFRRPLQIPAALLRLHHQLRRAAAPVPVTEGKEKAVYLLLLVSVLLPAFPQSTGTEHRVVLLIDMGKRPGTVDSLPPEQIVGELLAFRITAQQLLGGKIRHPAFLHNLRKRPGKTKGVRQPCQTALRPELPAKPAFPQHELPHQALSSRQIGVALHIYRTLRHKLSRCRLLLHPCVQPRIVFLQIFQNRGGTEQEFIIRIPVHQRRLVRIGSGGLPLRLLPRPEPRQIQMGLAECGIPGHGIPVLSGEKGPEQLCRLQDAPAAPGLLRLEIRRAGKPLQCLADLHGPQIALRQGLPEIVEGMVVRVYGKQLLVVNSEMTASHHALGVRRLRHGYLISSADSRAFRTDAMPRIAFRINLIALARNGTACQLHRQVPAVDGTRLSAVYIYQHFRPRPQMQQNTLSGGLRRHGKLCPKPGVFPFSSPFRPLRKRSKAARTRLLQTQMLHGGKAGKRYFPQLRIQNPPEGLVPYP